VVYHRYCINLNGERGIMRSTIGCQGGSSREVKEFVCRQGKQLMKTFQDDRNRNAVCKSVMEAVTAIEGSLMVALFV